MQAPITREAPPCTTPRSSELASFQTLSDSELEKMLRYAEQFLQAMKAGENPRWVSFVGHAGTGKTFLANALFEAARKIPKLRSSATLISPVKKFYWPRLLSRLRDQEYWLISELADCNFLFLDELSLEHDPSGFAGDRLSELLSVRCGKWTVLTSNLLLEAIGDIDKRIASRMIRDGSVVVQVKTMEFALR